MYKLLFSLIAGLLYPFAFAPYELWPLAIVAVALLFHALRNESPRRSALIGWLFGVASFGVGVSWLHVSMVQYGATPLWLAIPMTALFALAMALYPMLLGWASARLGHQAGIFIGLWVMIDWLRGWLFTGFPWLYPGYVLMDTPLAGLAPWGGIWLMTLAAVALGVLLAVLATRQWRALPAPLLLSLAMLVLALVPTQFTAQHPDAVPVALAQGNIPQDLRWQLTQQDATRAIYAELSDRVPENTLLIWPEAAITEFYQDAQPFLDDQGLALEQRGGALISGIVWRELRQREMHFYNSVTVLGGGHGLYHKQKLVPFGEYVPLQSTLRGLIPFFDLPMSSFTRGARNQPNLQALDVVVSPFICYEILYPGLVAERSHGSDVLLTISNDAWFGSSAGPHQHFQMTRLRALETGRWLLRGTNNGITAIINPQGQVVARLPQFERGLLQGEFHRVSGTTPFMLAGSAPVLLLAMALIALGRTRRPTPEGDAGR